MSWNWSGGHPKGKVAEVKTSGTLEIESKGKRVHKNADESNPAVHIERDGNDVVKRASELSRLRGGGEEETGGKDSGQGTGITAEEGAGPSQEAQLSQETGEKQATKKPAKGGRKGRNETTGATKKTTGGKRGRKKAATKEADVGEKRKREEDEAKEGEDVDVEKGKKEPVTTEGERKTSKKGKKAKIVPEGEQAAEPAGPASEKDVITADADAEHRAAAVEAENRISEASRTETVEA